MAIMRIGVALLESQLQEEVLQTGQEVGRRKGVSLCGRCLDWSEVCD